MVLQLTQEQELILQSVREFAQETEKETDSYQVVKGLADMDFLGIFYPEAYAGAGTDFTSFILAIEELAKTNASAALLYANQCSLVAYAIYRWGTEEQKSNYLPQLFSAETFGALAYIDKDPSEEFQPCTARREGDYFIINGEKSYVINGGKAGIYVVTALVDEAPSAFIVEKDAAGFACGPAWEKMGLDGVAVTNVRFDQVKVPAGNLLGQVGQGAEILNGILALNNIAMAAITVGICQQALEASVAYSKERIQFGRPIAKLQAIQTMIGDMATRIQAARLLAYQAAALKDQDKDYSHQADMARYFADTIGELVCQDAVQIHGGYGYSEDLGIERLFRDVKGISLFAGAAVPLCLKIARQELE
ncbi:MAG TPA: acyl-CoA dehydrogenase [Clostridia bacterium]|nr:acyl-CoA dehydrogenase [Clostridia bacterium]